MRRFERLSYQLSIDDRLPSNAHGIECLAAYKPAVLSAFPNDRTRSSWKPAMLKEQAGRQQRAASATLTRVITFHKIFAAIMTA